MIFKPASINPGRGRERFRQLGELATGVPRIDAIDWTDRSNIAIGEIIGATRFQAAP
jgi:hypothetical protein